VPSFLHTCYRIGEIERSVAFYEKLGFEEVARMPIGDEAINVFMGMPGATFGMEELAAAGAKRISVGSALARRAFGAFVEAAREMQVRGTFGFSGRAMGFAELEGFFTGKTTA